MTQGVRYDYPRVTRGDTVNAKRFTVSRNNSPEILNGVTVAMQIGDQTIEPTVDGNVVTVPVFTMHTVGEFKFDMQFTYPDGSVKTYIYGKIFVVADITP